MLLCLAGTLVVLVAAGPAGAAVTKLTSTDQPLAEAEGTVAATDGVVYASVKTTGKGTTFVLCDYSNGAGASLGSFQATGDAPGPDDVAAFCRAHFAERGL